MTDTPGWGSPQGPQDGSQNGGSDPDPNVPPGWSAQQPPAAPPPGQAGWTQPGQAGPGQQTWGQPGAGQQSWGGQQPGWGQAGWGQPRAEVKPGIVPLRPLGVGEILDGAISCMRAHPRPMIGLSAIVVTATQIIQLLLLWWFFRDATAASASLDADAQFSDIASAMGDSFALLMVGLLLGAAVQSILTGLLTVIVSRAVIGQDAPNVADAWNIIRPQILKLIGLSLIVTIVPVLGLFLCIVPGVYLWALFGLSTPALILERQSVFAAIKRSARLVSGSWWRVFGILLLATVLSIIIGQILATPFSVLGGGNPLDPNVDPERAFSFAALSLSAVGSIIAGTITYPFLAGVTVLLYVDQRIRREALDLELARAAGVNLPGQPDPQQGQQPGQPSAGPAAPTGEWPQAGPAAGPQQPPQGPPTPGW